MEKAYAWAYSYTRYICVTQNLIMTYNYETVPAKIGLPSLADQYTSMHIMSHVAKFKLPYAERHVRDVGGLKTHPLNWVPAT